jgi:hypothetical protein
MVVRMSLKAISCAWSDRPKVLEEGQRDRRAPGSDDHEASIAWRETPYLLPDALHAGRTMPDTRKASRSE